MKNITSRFKEAARRNTAAKIITAVLAGVLVLAGILSGRAAAAKRVLSSNSGEGYVDTAVKILMAVVIGALLLAGLYALFGDTVLPELTRRIQEMFSYNG